MNTVRAAVLPALLLAAGAALAACGTSGDRPPGPADDRPSAPTDTSVSGEPTAPRTTPTRPSGPPKTPTDVVSNDGSVVGTVTRGGPGPCFGLVTDDGTEYALYNADGLALTKGTRVRVHLDPSAPKIDCGPGRPMRLRDAQPL